MSTLRTLVVRENVYIGGKEVLKGTSLQVEEDLYWRLIQTKKAVSASEEVKEVKKVSTAKNVQVKLKKSIYIDGKEHHEGDEVVVSKDFYFWLENNDVIEKGTTDVPVSNEIDKEVLEKFEEVHETEVLMDITSMNKNDLFSEAKRRNISVKSSDPKEFVRSVLFANEKLNNLSIEEIDKEYGETFPVNFKKCDTLDEKLSQLSQYDGYIIFMSKLSEDGIKKHPVYVDFKVPLKSNEVTSFAQYLYLKENFTIPQLKKVLETFGLSPKSGLKEKDLINLVLKEFYEH